MRPDESDQARDRGWPAELSLQVRQGRGCTVVRLGGVLDLASEAGLRECLQTALDDGASHIVLDLAELRLMDSSGLGTIVTTYKTLQGRDGQLCLVAVQPLVRRVLELTSVDRLVSLHDTVEAAEEDLAATSGGR